jgi:hypothetical protein
VTSYDGKLFISFSGAASWIGDPQGLAECLTEAYEAMCEEVLPLAILAGKTSAAAGKKPKTRKRPQPAARKPAKKRARRAPAKAAGAARSKAGARPRKKRSR